MNDSINKLTVSLATAMGVKQKNINKLVWGNKWGGMQKKNTLNCKLNGNVNKYGH